MGATASQDRRAGSGVSGVYYNEFDRYAAAWLRNLIAAGLLPAGDVDERDIRLVRPSDLAGYRQCHFFAGVGGWPYALRLAGWPDDAEVWTGSCPCQPLSSAGKRRGHADERHLWPAFHRLIAERRPATVFGEQVASKDGREWLAGVRADLEALGYAVGAADLCAAGVGAPHIRQRLFWLADAELHGSFAEHQSRAAENERRLQQLKGHRDAGALADAGTPGRRALQRPAGADGRAAVEPDGHRDAGELGDADGARHALGIRNAGNDTAAAGTAWRQAAQQAGAWSDFDLLPCTDGKARRIEPGSFPLAHGVPGRVGRLRAYGNAIVPQVAAEFVSAVMEAA